MCRDNNRRFRVGNTRQRTFAAGFSDIPDIRIPPKTIHLDFTSEPDDIPAVQSGQRPPVLPPIVACTCYRALFDDAPRSHTNINRSAVGY